MKKTHTDEQLQTAIDEAIKSSPNSKLTTIHLDPEWTKQGRLRLFIAKTFLEKLEASTPHKPVPDGYTLLQDGAPEFEKLPEGTICLYKGVGGEAWELSGIVGGDASKRTRELLWYAIPTPDPYAELKKAHSEGKVIEHRNMGDTWTTCALPSWTFSPDFYRIKPEPSTFEAHGKSWTPAVGDIVMLKSGSPKMTIHFVDAKNGGCVGCVNFSNAGEFTFATLPPACLTLVTE